MRYQAWEIATCGVTLKTEATVLVYSSDVRLDVEKFIERASPVLLRKIFPAHLVTRQMRFEETGDERNTRLLRAFLLLQEQLLPRGRKNEANEAAHDAAELAILELTAALPGPRRR